MCDTYNGPLWCSLICVLDWHKHPGEKGIWDTGVTGPQVMLVVQLLTLLWLDLCSKATCQLLQYAITHIFSLRVSWGSRNDCSCLLNRGRQITTKNILIQLIVMHFPQNWLLMENVHCSEPLNSSMPASSDQSVPVVIEWWDNLLDQYYSVQTLALMLGAGANGMSERDSQKWSLFVKGSFQLGYCVNGFECLIVD